MVAVGVARAQGAVVGVRRARRTLSALRHLLQRAAFHRLVVVVGW